MEPDSYHTVAAPAESSSRERSSRFLAFCWPIEAARAEETAKERVEGLKKEYFDATHHCWAMRAGVGKEEWQRSSDDGEPAGTAGRPILGQILSAGLTDVLVVVVRYFGGTKLGVPGLIAAYKEAAREVIARSEVVERTVDESFTVRFPYASMNGVMRAVKQMNPRVRRQTFDNVCEMELSVRRSQAGELRGRLLDCEGASVEERMPPDEDTL